MLTIIIMITMDDRDLHHKDANGYDDHGIDADDDDPQMKSKVDCDGRMIMNMMIMNIFIKK